MIVQTSLLSVLFTIFHFVDNVNSEELLKSQKCRSGDDVCIGHTLTKLIQHSSEYPSLNIPKLDPYRPPTVWTMHSRESNLPISFAGNWSDISLYGFDKAVVRQVRLPHPSSMQESPDEHIQISKKIHGKFFIPMIVEYASMAVKSALFMWPIDVDAVINFNMSDVHIPVRIDCDIIQRDGKQYVSIKSVNAQLHITGFAQKTRYKDMGPFLTGIADEILDSNWKLVFESVNPDVEVYMGDIIKSILTSIFDKIALEEFFNGQSALEVNPIASDSTAMSSSSSSIQKLTCSALIWCTLLFSISHFDYKSIS